MELTAISGSPELIATINFSGGIINSGIPELTVTTQMMGG